MKRALARKLILDAEKSTPRRKMRTQGQGAVLSFEALPSRRVAQCHWSGSSFTLFP
jgi:hypothetical protein